MMKIVLYLFAAIISGMSFSSLATQEINQEQAASHQLIGEVSISGVRGSTDDAFDALRNKAEKVNAPYYRIIGVQNSGDSSDWSGGADLYR